MPPRRRKRRAKKRRKRTDPFKRRMGYTGWKGSKPFFGWSRTLTSVTLGEGHNPGVTTGAQFTLPVNNWNDPLGTLATLVAGTGSLTSNRHPKYHDNVIAQGYRIAQVLSWNARIHVNWIKADTPTGDFVVGYSFWEDIQTEVTLTAGDAGRIERLEWLTNPRWTLKHYKGIQGFGEARGKNEAININIPNVYRYCKAVADGSEIVAFGPRSMSHVIADVGFNNGPPAVELYCRVVIFSESGLAMAIDSVHVTIEITQKVKVMRSNDGLNDMFEGEVDVHA